MASPTDYVRNFVLDLATDMDVSVTLQCAWLACLLGGPEPVTFEPSWRTPTVDSLATTIDAKSAFDRLPILGDALEEAGCMDAAVLEHCRGPGPHVRGCWVVDGLLGWS
jgi:hypothetical protein